MTSLLGWLAGEMTGSNERARRNRKVAPLRAKATSLLARVAAAQTECAARRILAGCWSQLLKTQQRLAAGAHGTDIEGAGGQLLFVNTQQAVFAAPAFDDLPMHAAGLDCVDAVADPPVWVGHPVQLLEASKGLVSRGLRIEVDRDEQEVVVHRDAEPIAVMIGDATHAPTAERVEPVPPLARRPLWLLAVATALGVAGLVMVLSLDRPRAGGGVLLLAFLVAFTYGIVRELLNRKPRWLVATIASAPLSRSGAPYRDEHQPDRIAASALTGALRDGGLAFERRGRDLRVSTADGTTSLIRGTGTPHVRIADFRLLYRDVVGVVACVHALTACTGPLVVELADRTIVAGAPGDYAAWIAQYRRDRKGIETLIAELELGIERAVATI